MKILDYIKKGINVKNTEEILKNAHKAGISNNIYLLIGLPTETISDIAKNIEYLNRNKKYIDCIDIIPEVLFIPDSIIYKEKNKYKELIKVPIETRTNIAKEINKKFLSLENIAYFFPSPAINLYIKKYGKTKTKFLAKLLALTFN